jgi:hypothetical protein
MVNRAVAVVTAFLLLAMYLPAEENPQTPAPAKIQLVIVGGNDLINNINTRTSRPTIVQVEDENHRPVAGATVSFLLPNTGPGGTFAGGSRSVSLVTGSNGQVTMPRMTTNQLAGRFEIHVNANFQGQQATATITQQNIAPPPGQGHAGLSAKVIGVLAGAAAAGAATGIYLAVRGGGTPTGTVSVSNVGIAPR